MADWHQPFWHWLQAQNHHKIHYTRSSARQSTAHKHGPSLDFYEKQLTERERTLYDALVHGAENFTGGVIPWRSR